MQDGMTCEGVAPDPTLSELIEACGHDFMSLEFLPIPRNPYDGVDLIEGIHGASAEEAVARLWLALYGSQETKSST